MGKKKTKDAESLNNESQNQSGIFTTLFSGDVAKAENSGFSSLFSDDNPYRRKKPSVINDSTSVVSKKGNKRNADAVNEKQEEEEETVLPVKTKKPKKEKTLKSPVPDSEADGVEKETNLVAIEESVLDSKKKKRKKDELENEYETKKYGSVEKKVGEKRKKADEVADMMVSKEGFDDESKLLRTVFVGNLPLKVKKKLILKEFSKFGEVESVRIRSVPIVDSKKTRKGAILLKQINEKASSVHAYVVFETEESAEASLAHNMTLIDGNHIRVDRACPPRKKLKGDAHLYDPKRTVFIGNLPFDVKDEEVYQLFTGKSNLENNVEAVRVIRDSHLNIGKGIAYVLFKTREAANLVIKKGYLKLRERELRISRVKPDATPSKRKNDNPSEAYSSAQKRLRKDKVVTPTSTGKANLSYQGIRASKSGDDKKKSYQKSPAAQMKTRPRGSSSSNENKNNKTSSSVKQRSQKRPAVAARKMKANAKGSKESGGGKKFAGTKRKQEKNETAESFKKKKPKRF